MATLNEDSARILACVLLFGLTLLMGTLPVYLIELISRIVKKRKRNDLNQSTDSTNALLKTRFSTWSKIFTHDRVVQFLTQFGGGVLLYTAVIHMLPEIRENYEVYLENRQNSSTSTANISNTNEDDEEKDVWESLPIVDLLACAGFFGMFLIEEVMHSVFLKHDHHHHHQNFPLETDDQQKAAKKQPRSIRQFIQNSDYTPHVNESESNTAHCNGNSNGVVTISNQGTCGQNEKKIISLPETHPISSCQTSHYNTCDHRSGSVECSNNCDVESFHSIEIVPLDDRSLGSRIFDGFMIILAFSCHSIFDGISIGVQPTNYEIWTLLIAILSHKLIIAFILSFQIYEKCTQLVVNPLDPMGTPVKKPIKGAKLVLWLFSTLFALMSPFGMILVIIMNNSLNAPSESSLRIIILASLSAGTIVYIVFLEIIDKSSSRIHISGLVQWFALILGFAVMHLVSQTFHE